MRDWDDFFSGLFAIAFAVTWHGFFVWAGYNIGYSHALQSAYRNQGRLAAQSGVPVTDWPYHDYDGPEFQWVVGWHEAKRD